MTKPPIIPKMTASIFPPQEYNHDSTPNKRGLRMTKGQLACPCCGINGTKPILIMCVAALEKELGVEFQVISGYRCKAHNSDPKVGGAPNSMHLIGMAMDVLRPSGIVDLQTLWALCQKCGIRGLGVRETTLHFDVRKTPYVWRYGQGGKTFPLNLGEANH